MPAETPIVLFAYARPDHLKKTLESLKQNSVPVIYAFSDGAKDSGNAESVEQVRHILRRVDWCDMTLVERSENFGIGKAIRSGLTQVLDKHDRVIVVEEDIVLRPGAYNYAVSALKYYERHPEVMTISMWSHPIVSDGALREGYFSRRFVCWGWGTYREFWLRYQGNAEEIYRECQEAGLDVLSWGKDIEWQVKHSGERNLWYVGYALIHFLLGCYSYFPYESLVVNIGRDGSGENIGGGIQDDVSLLKKPVQIPEVWPDIQLMDGTDVRFRQYFDPRKPGLLGRARRLAGKLRIMITSKKARGGCVRGKQK